MKIFWSWQSDRPVAVTKNFIQECLNEAIVLLANDLTLSEAERPELDHDTKGEPGLVEIVNTIFAKIEKSTLFVADVTPVATTGQGKQIPNPNVMIELGYAMKSLGAKAIILVSNLEYGGRPEDLPFDLRHRRGAIGFRLRSTDTPEKRDEEKSALVEELRSAMRLNLQSLLMRKDGEIEFSRYPSQEGDSSIWLKKGQTLGHGDWFGGGGFRSLQVLEGTRSYLRVQPAGWARGKPTRHAVHESMKTFKLRPLGEFSTGDGGANNEGVVFVGLWPRGKDVCHTAVQWFDQSGEIWTFDSSVAVRWNENEQPIISINRLLKDVDSRLRMTLEFFAAHGAIGPYLIEAGVVGMRGVLWPAQFVRDRSQAYDDSISHQFKSRDWSEHDRSNFILCFYNKILNAFGKPVSDMSGLRGILSSTPE